MSRSTQQVSRRRLMDRLRLWGSAMVIVLSTIFPATWLVGRLQDPESMPVRLVRVEGELRHLNRRHLEEVVYQTVDGSFFTVSLAKLRDEVESLPWVESASLRRVWPDTLQVKVVEQQPLARWGRDGLVNLRGEIFRPDSIQGFDSLPVLEGDVQDSVSISQAYQKLKTLLGTVGLKLQQASVDARGAWILKTSDGGPELNLGRQQMLPRLTRFVRLYPRLQGDGRAKLNKVDLRYTNGFSTSWEVLSEIHTNGDSPEVKANASRLAGI